MKPPVYRFAEPASGRGVRPVFTLAAWNPADNIIDPLYHKHSKHLMCNRAGQAAN
jgi:hypothetical protein